MMKKSEPKKTILDKAIASKILRNVPSHEGFHFFASIGNPTNKTATSLVDFVEKLRTADIRSVDFHFQRQDFEKWLKTAIGDAELSQRISGIQKETTGEELRKQIIEIVKRRLDEIKGS